MTWIIANTIGPNAAEEMSVRWGIAVNRTELLTFPGMGRSWTIPWTMISTISPWWVSG